LIRIFPLPFQVCLYAQFVRSLDCQGFRNPAGQYKSANNVPLTYSTPPQRDTLETEQDSYGAFSIVS
jgi:hypothetical protein